MDSKDGRGNSPISLDSSDGLLNTLLYIIYMHVCVSAPVCVGVGVGVSVVKIYVYTLLFCPTLPLPPSLPPSPLSCLLLETVGKKKSDVMVIDLTASSDEEDNDGTGQEEEEEEEGEGEQEEEEERSRVVPRLDTVPRLTSQ